MDWELATVLIDDDGNLLAHKAYTPSPVTFITAAIPPGGSETFTYVAVTGSDTNDGQTWATATREINAAIALLPAGGGIAYVGPGEYAPFTLTSPNDRVSVIGIGAARVNATGSQVGITIDGTTSTPIVGPLIENIHINGDGKTGSTIGIRLLNGKRATIRRCRVADCLVGIDHYNDGAGGFSERNSIESTLINNCGTGMRYHRTATGDASFSYNQAIGFAIDSCTTGLDMGASSAAIPLFFGVFLIGVIWGQSNSDVLWKVAGDMAGVFAKVDLERIAGTSVVGVDVQANASNTGQAHIISKFTGTFGTKVQAASGKFWVYWDGINAVVTNGSGVNPSLGHMNDAGTVPGVRFTNRSGTTIGAIELGSGAGAPDVEIYREQANVLKVNDQLVVTGAIAMKTKAGIPTDADTDLDIDGNMILDTTNNRIYFRSGGTWRFAALT